jgi:hypothetical protein
MSDYFFLQEKYKTHGDASLRGIHRAVGTDSPTPPFAETAALR